MEESRSVATLEIADRMLAEVASVDDAKQLINYAERARIYARQSKLGTSAINHATIIKIRAERVLADIVDEGQARGEIATPGGDRDSIVRTPDNRPATLPDIDVDRQRLAEARLLRDSYTDADLAAKQAEANERDEILTRQKLLADARAENDRNGAIQRERVAVLFPVYEALAALATVDMPAKEWATHVLDASAYRVNDNIEPAFAWLTELREVWSCR